ncbi:RNA 2',3'-cyclic phosphodiesterase [Spirochaeta isovalerica]|uniref:RNA 2',3'-cyclic phosphodiesterase n=1 Tax=Spirochaeta isovalerica TaxID=150 RepID=A0A841R8S0_9SPIO|nr:RNA 2',3'-cyclic phosphodiesterase [Spirochaeta isovalerica]MBB6480196.1 2'-5' RNA ligase [Spirochaeta isovalerica]
MDYRLFVAIDLPDAVRDELSVLCRHLERVRWTPQDQFHLTLRFIGRGDGALVRDLCEQLSSLEPDPFSLILAGTGYFPPRGMPNILWAGVQPSDQLKKLYRRVDEALFYCGVKREGRKFAPHITLGRLTGEPHDAVGEWLAGTASFRSSSFDVRSFHLYTSRLTSRGALHTKLASF